MRQLLTTLAIAVILLAAIGMQYLTLTYGAVVEGFIRDAFGWISIALAFVAGGAITALATDQKQ